MTTDRPEFEDTWLVVPLYNEEAVVASVIRQALHTFPNIVCVDDGSTDSSADEAQRAGAVVIHHPLNLGQGAALQTGIDFVLSQPGAQYLVTYDADGQHRVEDAASMVRRAREADLAVVFGSRFLDSEASSGPQQVSGLRRLTLRAAAAFTGLQTGLKLTDAHNGLRLIRRDAAAKLQLSQDRMAHASQIVGQLAKTGLAWEEAPVYIRYTPYSKSKGQSLLNSVNIVVDLVVR